ncbi:SMI1/KNR4 family protein [Kribbella sp. NPDC050124]|uniref:SMI1/KNR4 family protein n=1 Tax=Kribbella sp. NPDC050124 TaxID=3364114 RepID=UPI0037A99B26
MNLDAFFATYRGWLQGVAPGVDATLRGPATEAEVDRYEETVGAELPAELRQLWAIHDGEAEAEPSGGTIGGLVFLGVAESLREWADWSSLRDETSDEDMQALRMFSASVPADAIQQEYTAAGWLPILKESMEGNYLGLDLAPGPGGQPGQVINFGRDEDRKAVISRSMSDLLGFIASEAQQGEIVVSSVEPRGLPVLAHRRGRLISVVRRLAESRGPLA